MTKQIRIENADTSDHKVVVQIWQKNGEEEILTEVKRLDYPTAMETFLIYQGQYLVIKEVEDIEVENGPIA